MSDMRWPVLTSYDAEHLRRIALPLGGIGTGTVSLGGRGDLRDWEIVNRPAKGFIADRTFFALYAKAGNEPAIARALEGRISPHDYEGNSGSAVPNHGLPRFRDCRFEAAYPLGQVHLSDPNVPLDVRLEAFNPLIPGDADRSGIPVAVLRYVLTNKTDQPVTASVCGSLHNFIGSDGTVNAPKKNYNTFRTADALSGIFLRSEGVDPQAEQWGTMALTAMATENVTSRTAWANVSWGDIWLDFWDDFSADGRLEQREDDSNVDAPMASLAVGAVIPPYGTHAITFLLAWHFPNRMTWTPAESITDEPGSCCEGGACGEPAGNPDWIGNYYTTQYRDAWDAAQKTAAALPQLEADTLAFVRAFCESDLPAAVQEAALYNLSTLRSQTSFRTPDGRFYGWEGCADKVGCCFGSCTHVWNYEVATAFLFGQLSRTMRDVEFAHATDAEGRMNFRISLPLGRAPSRAASGAVHIAADGQMGCLMKLYRDWRLSGDDAMLRALWPSAKKSLEFCWVPGGWDADKDGVMEGCQHNTMDIEYYGPNPEVGTWYLGALRAAEEMARYGGDSEFADTCQDLFARGSHWMDANLFNGEYYEQQIVPPMEASAVAPGLILGMGAANLSDPELQIGAGCLVDQLVGQYMAHICGLGYLLDPAHIEKTLQTIMQYNFQADLHGHFNHLRSYALGDEAGLIIATYPKGRRPVRPFPYYNEVWTGLEYVAAAGMIYENQTEPALEVVRAARARYDGLKRSPFDEAECGHHYARAMSSWALVLACTGFHYDGVDKRIEFAATPAPSRVFWSNGDAWGTCAQTPSAADTEVKLAVLHGMLIIRSFVLSGHPMLTLPDSKTISAGETAVFTVTPHRES